MTDLPEVSTLDVLKSQRETRFCGEKLPEGVDASHPDADVQDSIGRYYSNPHDFLQFKLVNGKRVGVIVGDFDGRHAFDHAFDNYPHAMALWVNENYRRQGIATELLDAFMQAAPKDTYVSDCPRSAVLFHVQTNWDVIYLKQVRRNNTATKPPTFERDIAHSPQHAIPFFYADKDAAIGAFITSCVERGSPPVYITLLKHMDKYEIPDTHPLGGDETTNVYVGYPPDRGLCSVVIPYTGVTESDPVYQALQRITTDLQPIRSRNSSRLWRRRDVLRTCRVTPDTARDIADKAYDTVEAHDTSHLREQI